MDKKPSFALLIADRMKKGPSKEVPEGDEHDEQHDHEVSAMQDFIDAVHDKDPEAALEALHDWYELCYGDGSDMDDESKSDEKY